MPAPDAGDRLIEVDVERPVAGGAMLGRHEGRVVLVRGAIPGERVRVRVLRAQRDLLHAETVDVLRPSVDRRAVAPTSDSTCGGQVYRHVAYARQLRLKGEVIRDALVRLGGVRWSEPLEVLPSPEEGYRLRARVFAGPAGLGFRREGTHETCDARGTGQLSDGAVAALDELGRRLEGAAGAVEHVELAENLDGSERVAHVQLVHRVDVGELRRWAEVDAITGFTARVGARARLERVAGRPTVSDPLAALASRVGLPGRLARRAPAFFQANRFLLSALVTHVLDRLGPGPVTDLYAGVGLFAATAAAVTGADVTAVERDRDAVVDLRQNATTLAPTMRVEAMAVERYLASTADVLEGTVIVDPPRAGLTRGVVRPLVTRGASRVVYVSCDPPTFARDVRRLAEVGFELDDLAALDLFPNTAHVELVALLRRETATSVVAPRNPSAGGRGSAESGRRSPRRRATRGSARRSR